jgi:pilus assembly protein CpaE
MSQLNGSDNREQTSVATATARSSQPQSLSMNALSAVVLSNNEGRRRSLAGVLSGTQAQILREGPLPSLDALPSLLEGECDILIVDLLDQTERALEIVETAVASHPGITVMVYSPHLDSELLVQSMRAGAREFLSDPLTSSTLTEAFVRAFVRRDDSKRQKKTTGKCLVFIGAKGGSGVTTVASNFAVALAQDTGESVALLDLDLQLGDAALTLGLSNKFSTLDAFDNQDRLDSDLLSKLMVSHSSGVQVLAAPNEHNVAQPPAEDVMKVVNLIRQDFAWLVVDAGSHYHHYAERLYEAADKVYLVTQVSVAELRNCHRLIAKHFADEAAGRLEVVLNRFVARSDEIGEQSIAKVLSDRPRWKVPSEYRSVREAQNRATPLALSENGITQVILDMVRATTGKKVEVKKRKFGLF